ncbi:MAG: peptidase M66 [Burkholderiales bacterium]|nr:MAG: peptidase M66 [Burkholderiales bacterium]
MNSHLLRFVQLKRWFAVSITVILAACGGSSDGVGSTSPKNANSSSSTTAGTKPPAVMPFSAVEYGQTHVLPASGSLVWSQPDSDPSKPAVVTNLHLVGGRDALFMVNLTAANPVPIRPRVEVLRNGALVKSYLLDPPNKLPPTEGNGVRYSNLLHSTTLDASVVKPGMALQLIADNYSATPLTSPVVGLDGRVDVTLLPFYLFGASETTTVAIATATAVPPDALEQIQAQWPVATVTVASHSAGSITWPYMVVRPRDGNPAYRIQNLWDRKGLWDVNSSMLAVVSALRSANGQSTVNNLYYAPMLTTEANSKYSNPPGLATIGDLAATGDWGFGGLFIHETGHSFGMSHAGDESATGVYPYPSGSLQGSRWGYDTASRVFRPIYLPKSLQNTAGCSTAARFGRVMDPINGCIKQDPMAAANGDQEPGRRFTIFSDFNAGRIQGSLEGSTTVDPKDANKYVYAGGRVLADTNSSTGYSRWNSILNRRVEWPKTTTDADLQEANRGMPIQQSVPVYTVIVTYSRADTADVSQIYPPISYSGNLLRTFDPTVAADRAAINPANGIAKWYCRGTGCDYTLRVTYTDGSIVHSVLVGGFRQWGAADPKPTANALDPLSPDSFKLWGVNVPGGKKISTIEVLETPTPWLGLGANPKVVLLLNPL